MRLKDIIPYFGGYGWIEVYVPEARGAEYNNLKDFEESEFYKINQNRIVDDMELQDKTIIINLFEEYKLAEEKEDIRMCWLQEQLDKDFVCSIKGCGRSPLSLNKWKPENKIGNDIPFGSMSIGICQLHLELLLEKLKDRGEN